MGAICYEGLRKSGKNSNKIEEHSEDSTIQEQVRKALATQKTKRPQDCQRKCGKRYPETKWDKIKSKRKSTARQQKFQDILK